MSMGDAIVAAVTPVVPICVPDLYTGAEKTYCTYNFTEIPAAFGDDTAHAVRYLIQLHLFLPPETNPAALKRSLRRAILAAGFTAPTITPNNDEISQDYVFEFEDAGGDV
jgi:hypothetical protein